MTIYVTVSLGDGADDEDATNDDYVDDDDVGDDEDDDDGNGKISPDDEITKTDRT